VQGAARRSFGFNDSARKKKNREREIERYVYDFSADSLESRFFVLLFCAGS
jgi:hypothetical protein